METKTDAFWDRERLLTFASMAIGAWAWIMTERLLVGMAVGIATQCILTLLYEILAHRFGWKRLPYVDQFIIPAVARFIPRRAQKV